MESGTPGNKRKTRSSKPPIKSHQLDCLNLRVGTKAMPNAATKPMQPKANCLVAVLGRVVSIASTPSNVNNKAASNTIQPPCNLRTPERCNFLAEPLELI